MRATPQGTGTTAAAQRSPAAAAGRRKLMRGSILAIAVGVSCAAVAAQDAGVLRQSASQYAQSRQAAGKGFILTPEQAAEQLRKPARPTILDLRPAGEFAKFRLKGSQRLSLDEMFAPGTLQRFQIGRASCRERV